jgi:hypothetical protein
MWNSHIRGVTSAAVAREQLIEIRYEDLRRKPEEELKRLLEWLGIDADEDFIRDSVERCSLDRLKAADPQDLPVPGAKTPKGFFGQGKVGGWNAALRPRQVRAIEYLCRENMARYGYEMASRPTVGTKIAVGIHDSVNRVRESIDWQLQRIQRVV